MIDRNTANYSSDFFKHPINENSYQHISSIRKTFKSALWYQIAAKSLYTNLIKIAEVFLELFSNYKLFSHHSKTCIALVN